MITVGILTVSDRCSRGEQEDKSGDTIRRVMTQFGSRVVDYACVPDERFGITRKLIEWADKGGVDLVITTGGTGLAPRDVTPEATLEVVDRTVPGLSEAMRAKGMKKTAHAMISRAVCGVRNETLIINLPGNPNAVKEGLLAILPALPHALDVIAGEAAE